MKHTLIGILLKNALISPAGFQVKSVLNYISPRRILIKALSAVHDGSHGNDQIQLVYCKDYTNK